MYMLNILSKAEEDFTSVTLTVIFLAGESRASVSVPIINDILVEMTEVFTATLSGVTESVIIGADTADVTIIDIDSECIYNDGTLGGRCVYEFCNIVLLQLRLQSGCFM